MRIVFLGTGASRPSLRRNVSSVAVQFDGSIVLLDVGEATQHRFLRANASPMKVDYIFISHLHGDHFLGLTPFLQSLGFMGRKRALRILVPDSELHEIWKAVNLGYSSFRYPIEVIGVSPGEELRFGDLRFSFARALHGVPALAVRIDEGRGRSIVYSGDTAPSPEILSLAKGASVLIHDALCASDREPQANLYGHSSSRQAAAIAREAGVELLILTHLSQAYEGREEVLLGEAREIFPDTVIAEDLMEVIVRARPPHRISGSRFIGEGSS